MNLLAAALYDPSSAVTNKATTAALAMTAFDTTNLRLTFTAPPSGRVFIRIICSIHGATTCPQILLGCLESTTVRGRVVPEITVSNLAATSLMRARAEYVLPGLTPGQSYTFDAAYGVETLVASTNIKYGGPNNTTANDNFGAFQFEIWDPSPIFTAASGVPPTTTVHQKLDTIDDFVDTEIAALVSAVNTIDDFLDTEMAAVLAAVDTEVGAIKAKTDSLTFTTSGKVDATIQAAADLAQAAADKVWATATRVLTAGTNIVLAKGVGVTGFNDLSAAQVNAEADTALSDVGLNGTVTGRIDAAVSSRSTYAGADTAGTTTLLSRLTSGRAGALDYLDAAISTRASSADLATVAGYLDTEIAAILAVTNALPDAGAFTSMFAAIADLPTNAELTTALAGADDAVLAAIGALHDFDPETDEVLANIKRVNDITVGGDGQPGTEWGPA